ncbi:hypothetical protein BMF94_6221 [Rhodotorula taiwanensis]|uniref:Peptidyl-prolyl cis-trans isomerase n=1 Tax=Rhodotorula taiwanensis TaxID=741276 RepID=A0A2S5B204_9BASI|nr:hypothetical protein BMF94_6221 [Rhodotorula taiwanensis]
MAPKGKAKKETAPDESAADKLKPAQQLKLQARRACRHAARQSERRRNRPELTQNEPGTQLRHILCEKHSKSQQAIERLQKGEAFDKVAADLSEDKARTGGALGWMTRTGMIGVFQEEAFDIPPSEVRRPIYKEIKSKFGYHIVMVEDRK